jgi:hypothetical protein
VYIIDENRLELKTVYLKFGLVLKYTQVKEDEVGRACSTNWGEKECI